MKIGFVGLGVMGYPMAGHLQAAGHDVTVYNRTTEKAIRWVAQYGGDRATSPGEAADGAQLVCLCVGNDDDVRSVVTGPDGILPSVTKGAVIVDHTTKYSQGNKQWDSLFGVLFDSLSPAPKHN